MTEETTKQRKKVYAEVIAKISFTGAEEDVLRIAAQFLGRRGITMRSDIGRTKASPWSSAIRVDFEVSYRVHGGWRSDIVRKIETDAADLGASFFDLEVEIQRTELPQECPRRECVPCAVARGETRYSDVYQRLEPITEVPQERGLLSRFRR